MTSPACCSKSHIARRAKKIHWTESEMIHDVEIVGGGICGLSIGWKLAKRGLRVLILEKGEAGHGATWAALGILFPRVGDDPNGPAFTKLCVESHRLWPTFAKEVESESGIEIDYGRGGGVHPARAGRAGERVQKEVAPPRRVRGGAERGGREVECG